MFVQKKYPKVHYTMHVELTQADVENIMQEAHVLDEVVLNARRNPNTIAPVICGLLSAIRQEASVPYGC